MDGHFDGSLNDLVIWLHVRNRGALYKVDFTALTRAVNQSATFDRALRVVEDLE